MAAEAGGLLDAKNTIDISNFDGTEESWKKLASTVRSADLAGMVAHLDAAEQTAFIKQQGLDANSLLVSGTIHALRSTKCECKLLSLVSLLSTGGTVHDSVNS